MVLMLSRSQCYLCNRSVPGKVIFKPGCFTFIAFVRTNIDGSKIMTKLSLLEVNKLIFLTLILVIKEHSIKLCVEIIYSFLSLSMNAIIFILKVFTHVW